MTSMELLSLIFAGKNQEEDRVERQREGNKSDLSYSPTLPHYLMKK